MQTSVDRSKTSLKKMARQEPFWRVAPVVRSALLLGASAGFVLAALLRVGSLLLAPVLAALSGSTLTPLSPSASGPLGLTLAICLLVNLWPALRTQRS